MQTQEKQVFPMVKLQNSRSRPSSSRWVSPILIIATAFGIIISFNLEIDPYTTDVWKTMLSPFTKGELIDPKDYLGRAKRVLQSTPLIDGHNDFPFLLRQQLHGQIYGYDFENETMTSHTNFQKMKDGMMGGQFWSVYVPCPEDLVPGVDLLDPNRRIPDLNEPNVCISSRIIHVLSV